MGGILRVLCVAISTPFLLNTMGLEKYGTWSLISAIVGILTIAEAGLSSATTVFIAQDVSEGNDAKLSETITVVSLTIILLALTASLILYSGSEAIISFFPTLNVYEKEVALKSLRISSLVIFGQLIQQLFIGIEQAFHCYKLINILSTLQWTLFCFGWCFIAFLKFESVELITWQLIVTLLFFVIHFYNIRKILTGRKVSLSWDKKRAFEIANYCSSSWLATLGGLLFTKGDRLIVASLLGSSYLSIYSVFSDLCGSINYFSAKPIQPLLPSIGSYERGSIPKNELVLKLRKIFSVNACISVLLGTLLLLFSKLIVSFLVQSDTNLTYVNGFRYLIVITTLYSLNSVGYFILLGLKKVRVFAYINICSGAISLLLIYYGSINYGFMGAILGNVGFVLTLAFSILSLHYLRIAKENMMYWIVFPVSSFLASFITSNLIANEIYSNMILVVECIAIIVYLFFEFRHKKIRQM